MKNILFIITKSENGGAQKWTKEQIEISKSRFKCYLATDQDGWLVQAVHAENFFLNKLIHKRASIKYLLMLHKFIKENKIELIVASSANAGIYARLVKLLNKQTKVIYVSHGWSSIYNGGKLTFLYTLIEKQLSKITDSILCVSKKDFINAKNRINIDTKKLHLTTNKIHAAKCSIKQNQTKKRKILTVARLCPPKRIDLLIKAVIGLNVELHIIGDGILKAKLEKLSQKNIVFHGLVANFQNFCEYDIFCLISDSEGLPLSALEAMSVGMPLVLSDVGGCSELIAQNGCLVQNNVKSIVKGIEFCMKNYDIFAANSKKLFDKRYNLLKFQDEYIKYYDHVLKG